MEQRCGGEILCLTPSYAWCFWLTCKIFESSDVSWCHPSHHPRQTPTPTDYSALKYTSPTRRCGNMKVRNVLHHSKLYKVLNSPKWFRFSNFVATTTPSPATSNFSITELAIEEFAILSKEQVYKCFGYSDVVHNAIKTNMLRLVSFSLHHLFVC